jgi:hypothetical protein
MVAIEVTELCIESVKRKLVNSSGWWKIDENSQTYFGVLLV